MPTTNQEAQDYFHALDYPYRMKYGRAWWSHLDMDERAEWQHRLDIWLSFD